MELNMQILYALEALRNPFLNYVMMGITTAGSEASSIAAMLVIYWCINKYDGYYMMANFTFGSASVLGLKACAQVPRPFVAHPDFQIVEMARSTADGFSFPSGHSENSTVLFGGLTTLFKKYHHKTARILCMVMIPLVMFSRLYLGAHYPTDVLGGFTVGLIVLLIIRFLFRNAEKDPKVIPLIYGVGGLIVLAVTIAIELGPWTNAENQQFMADTARNLTMISGLILACAVSVLIERKFVNFDTHAVWWAQILKVVAGAVLMLVIRAILKYPLQAIFGTFFLGDLLRYFIMTLFGMCIWPMTFKWFSRLGNNG